ncbi:hypothetical protein F4826_003533 [Rahnella inusitata]|nr:hypothetical protein [Rahnella inusitata]
MSRNGIMTRGDSAAKTLHEEKVKVGKLSKYARSDSNPKKEIVEVSNKKKSNPKKAKNLCLASYMINTPEDLHCEWLSAIIFY